MKYLLFAGDEYYPLGGVDDLKGRFASDSDALDWLKNADGFQSNQFLYWAHLVDTETMEIVFRWERRDSEPWVAISTELTD